MMAMNKKPLPTNKLAIASAFSAAAATYDQAAYIEQEIGKRLIAKLSDLELQPQWILDLGCGTGAFTRHLQALYPFANIIGLDIAFGMVNFAKSQHKTVCCGDAELLPFLNTQFDLIVSNCCLPSINNLPGLFIELMRVLKINGVLLFTAFGPDTLQALALDNSWPDMHVIGDILLEQNYKNPVLDTEHLTFTYNKLLTLCTDLQNSGAYNIDTNGIIDINLPFNAVFEVIYGIATKQQTARAQYKDQHGNVYIPITDLTVLNS